MTTILVNCIFLAKTEPIEEAEFFFLAIYSIEMFIKIIAKGFVLNKYTYLRNPWNWLDFLVITSGYATIGMGEIRKNNEQRCFCTQHVFDNIM